MAEWTVVSLDKDARGLNRGGTSAMRVPSGIVLRCDTPEGIAMTFVPISGTWQGEDIADKWIDENKIGI